MVRFRILIIKLLVKQYYDYVNSPLNEENVNISNNPEKILMIEK